MLWKPVIPGTASAAIVWRASLSVGLFAATCVLVAAFKPTTWLAGPLVLCGSGIHEPLVPTLILCSLFVPFVACSCFLSKPYCFCLLLCLAIAWSGVGIAIIMGFGV